MLTLIVFLLLAGVLVYLAQNNLSPVTVYLGTIVFSGIPLFYVIVGSILAGLAFAYIMSVIDSIFVGFTLRGKDSVINQGKNEIAALRKRIHELESENTKIRLPATNGETREERAGRTHWFQRFKKSHEQG